MSCHIKAISGISMTTVGFATPSYTYMYGTPPINGVLVAYLIIQPPSVDLYIYHWCSRYIIVLYVVGWPLLTWEMIKGWMDM